MTKRPKIKGRGADVFLGGDSERHLNLPPKKFAEMPVASRANAEPEREREFRSESKSSSCALGLKNVLEFHIRSAEMLAMQAIEVQEQSTRWAKNTPLAALIEVQSSIARKIVECAAAAARNLWRIRD